MSADRDRETRLAEAREEIARAIAVALGADPVNPSAASMLTGRWYVDDLLRAAGEHDALRRDLAALPEHLRGDGPCSRCGTADNPVWFTDNVFWNVVVRSAPLPWTEGDGFMCINCFVRLVDERGYAPTGWRLVPDWHWETTSEADDRRALLDGGEGGR